MNKVISILSLCAVLVFSLHVFSNNDADVDLWGNVGFVTAMPWSASFAYTNTFSFTEPDHPWINHEWLSQYLFYRLFSRFGNAGLLIFKICVGMCILALLALSARRFSSSAVVVRTLWMLLVISTVGYGFSTRPHLFTYLFYSLFLLVIVHHRQKRSRLLYSLPLFGLAWANLHGAFFSGAILIALYAIGASVPRYAGNGKGPDMARSIPAFAVLALFVGASCINPYGVHLWTFIGHSAMHARSYLSEWTATVHPSSIVHHPDYAVLAILTVAALVFTKVRRDRVVTGIVLAALLSSLAMRRNIPLFALTAGIVMPGHVESMAGEALKKLGGTAGKAIFSAVLVLCILASLWSLCGAVRKDSLEIEIPQDRFPAGIVSFMEVNGLSGNALVFFDWSEYCIWKLYPRCRVFLDGRFMSAYSPETIRRYLSFIYAGTEWEDTLTEYPVDIVLIHRGNPAYSRMLTLSGWSRVREDGIAALFLKESRHESFLARQRSGDLDDTAPRETVYFP